MIVAICLIGTMVVLTIVGSIIVLSTSNKKEVRVTTRSDIMKHKELQKQIITAKYAYEKALAELTELEAVETTLKLSINQKMGEMGFMSRLMLPFSK
jgi:hypothetical protein